MISPQNSPLLNLFPMQHSSSVAQWRKRAHKVGHPSLQLFHPLQRRVNPSFAFCSLEVTDKHGLTGARPKVIRKWLQLDGAKNRRYNIVGLPPSETNIIFTKITLPINQIIFHNPPGIKGENNNAAPTPQPSTVGERRIVRGL